MKRIHIFSVFLALCIYAPIHELGHWLVARLIGVQILSINYSSVIVNELAFSNTFQLIFFKAAGLIATFYPSIFLFSYLWRSDSQLWQVPFTWIIIAPIAASRDFSDIGNVVGNIALKQWLLAISEISTGLLLMAYAYEIILKKHTLKLL